MATQGTPLPPWVDVLPSSYDIVTAYYPESKPKAELRLRPCLVIQVIEWEDGTKGCVVVFGTKHLKLAKRLHLDIIVGNSADIEQFGLSVATRFDLDSPVPLPWHPDAFGCWSGRSHPRIGTLSEKFIRDYAFKMLSRRSV